MDIAWTVELAVHVSRQSDLVIEAPGPLPEKSLQDFWVYSRRRISDWIQSRNRCDAELRSAGRNARPQLRQELEALLSEFFVSDVLIRLWSAVLTAADSRRGTSHGEAIARHVHVNHLQARYLALKWIVERHRLPRPSMMRLNALRRSTERWTDMLLGRLVCCHDVADFAFDEQQARDFGEAQLAYRDAGTGQVAWDLILAGARLNFPTSTSTSPWRTACLRRVASAVLATFPKNSLFSSAKSTSLQRALFSHSRPDADENR